MTDRLRHIFFLLTLLCLPSLFSSCSKQTPEKSSGKLYLRAAQLPFLPEGAAPATKAINNGYLTTFESGDKIGISAIDAQGNVIPECDNLMYVYDSQVDEGGVIWSTFLNEKGYAFVEKFEGARYFAYYPYDVKWNGCNLDYIINHFDVLADQSSKEAFNSSDLMTAEAISPSNGELRFALSHKMATISIFYNNEFEPDGQTPLYPIYLMDGTSPGSLTIANTYRERLSDGSLDLRHRYLVNPRKLSSVKLVGRLEEQNTRFFSRSLDIEAGVLYSISFEGEPMVPYTDGVDLELDDVPFIDRDGNETTLSHTVYWSRYNLGESLGETYFADPAAGDRGTRRGSRDEYGRGDYYSWGATFTQYDNGFSGYKGYSYNNYFDKQYKLAPLGGTIKETEYDVAHAKWWRGKWRLPTENEFRAMYAGCTFEKVTTYSESQTRYMGSAPNTKRTFTVYKVTSKKNPEKFIYMSSGGYLDGTMEPEYDSEGNFTESGDGKKNNGIQYPATAYYMSSSASPTILRCVSYAYFTHLTQQIKVDGSRYTGMLVRPVYSPNEK